MQQTVFHRSSTTFQNSDSSNKFRKEPNHRKLGPQPQHSRSMFHIVFSVIQLEICKTLRKNPSASYAHSSATTTPTKRFLPIARRVGIASRLWQSIPPTFPKTPSHNKILPAKLDRFHPLCRGRLRGRTFNAPLTRSREIRTSHAREPKEIAVLAKRARWVGAKIAAGAAKWSEYF